MGRTRHENNSDFRTPRLRPAEEEEKWTERDYWENEDGEEDEDFDIYDGLDNDVSDQL